MQYFDGIDISEGIGVKKTSKSIECNICHYLYFSDKGFKFQPTVCIECHDLLMMTMNLSNVTISNITNAEYHCILSRITKSEAINLIENTDLTEKSGTL